MFQLVFLSLTFLTLIPCFFYLSTPFVCVCVCVGTCFCNYQTILKLLPVPMTKFPHNVIKRLQLFTLSACVCVCARLCVCVCMRPFLLPFLSSLHQIYCVVTKLSALCLLHCIPVSTGTFCLSQLGLSVPLTRLSAALFS